jgi:hypothetical protein
MSKASLVNSRLRSLVAVYDAFHQALQREVDPQAQKLCANWASVKPQYAGSPLAGTPSQLSAGLEQGLRELPMLFQQMSAPCRVAAAQALASALQEHLPSFAAEQDERLAKVVARGSVRSEREFYLVRHAIDIAESSMQPRPELSALYSLVERYESRSRRVA